MTTGCCVGIVLTGNAGRPIKTCGAPAQNTFCAKCSHDPAQQFWKSILKPNWENAQPGVLESLLGEKPPPTPKRKPPRAKGNSAIPSREEARRILLGG